MSSLTLMSALYQSEVGIISALYLDKPGLLVTAQNESLL